MLLEWQDEAMGYIYIYQHSSKYYRKLHRVCMFLSILLVIVGGLGAMFVEAYKVKWPVLVFAGLGIAGAILQAIDEKFDLAAEAARHDEARKSFLVVPRKIQLELRRERSHRSDADTFANGVEELFSQVQRDAPDPLEKYVRMWIELKQLSGKRIDTESHLQLYTNPMGATSSLHDTRRVVQHAGRASSTKQLPVGSAPVLEPISEGREKFTVGREDVVSGPTPARRGMFRIETTYGDVLQRDPAKLPNRLPHKVLTDVEVGVCHTDPAQYLESVYKPLQAV